MISEHCSDIVVILIIKALIINLVTLQVLIKGVQSSVYKSTIFLFRLEASFGEFDLENREQSNSRMKLTWRRDQIAVELGKASIFGKK